MTASHDDQMMAAANIRTVGVVGLGLLGRGITACLLGHGLRVIAYDSAPEAREAAGPIIASALAELNAHAQPTPSDWPARLQLVETLTELAPVDFLIESAVENLEAKQGLLTSLEEVVGSDVPLATNTSAIPITQIQSGCRYPERVLGMHWAEPAFITRFLELIPGTQTAQSVLDLAECFGRRLGKFPCRLNRDSPGFIVNRIAYAMYREACSVVEEGVADPATVDRALMLTLGLWAPLCGPFAWIDLTGGPQLYARAMSYVSPHLSQRSDVPPTLANKAVGEAFYPERSPEQRRQLEERLHEQSWLLRGDDKQEPH